MDDTNPLIQAMQSQKKGPDFNDPQALLEFILSKFNLVPKDDAQEEQGEPEDQMVQTQESHAP